MGYVSRDTSPIIGTMMGEVSLETYAFFLFNIKTIHSQYYNILGWIVSDIKQRGMEYLLIISGNILELIPNKINSEIENQPPKKVKLTKVNARRKPSLIALR